MSCPDCGGECQEILDAMKQALGTVHRLTIEQAAAIAIEMPGKPFKFTDIEGRSAVIVFPHTHQWQEQPGEPPVDVCTSCGITRQ